MPGLSNRNPVPGYGNMGKVHIRYKEKKPPKYKLGFFVYLLCLLLFMFSWTWTRLEYRYAITLPLRRRVVCAVDSLRLWQNDFQRRRQGTHEEKTEHSLLSGNVHISIDKSSGAIEISSQSMEDVLYGQGYVHCSERMFQMDFNRHRAAGRLAEVFDANQVESDKWAKALDLPGLAAADLAAQSSLDRELLESYAAGVNAFLAEKHPLPAEYLAVGITEVEEWLPVHSLAVLRMHVAADGGGSEAWQRELTRSVVERAVGSEQAVSWGVDEEVEGGISNISGGSGKVVLLPGGGSGVSCVVSGGHMDSGVPTLFSSLVTELNAPNNVIQNTLTVTSPGHSSDSSDMHVTGTSYPGVPFITLSGRNRAISWSLAPSAVDTADLFQETIRVTHDEEGGMIYEYLSESRGDDGSNSNDSKDWLPAAVRTETIVVRAGTSSRSSKGKSKQKNHERTEITVDCLQTSRGVVLPLPHTATAPLPPSAHQQYHLSLNSTEFNHPLLLSPWRRLNTAQSWADFNGALDDMSALSFNALYADTFNNIGSRVTGRSPVRASGHSGLLPSHSAGWTGDEEVTLALSGEGAVAGADTETADSDSSSTLCASCVFNPSSGLIVVAPTTLLRGQTRSWEQEQAVPSLEFSAESLLSLGDVLPAALVDGVVAVSPSSVLLARAKRTRQAIEVAVRHVGDYGREGMESVGVSVSDLESLRGVLSELQREEVEEGADSPGVFLEVFYITLRDMALGGAGSWAPFVFGASHSPFRRTTALYENHAFLDDITSLLLNAEAEDIASNSRGGGSTITVAATVVRAAVEAVAWLERGHGKVSGNWLGSSEWTWKKVLSMRFSHPLARMEYFGEVASPGPLPPPAEGSRRLSLGGDSVTERGQNVDGRHMGLGCELAGRWGSDGRCRTTTYRSVFEMHSSGSNGTAGVFMIVPGQSGRLSSLHYVSHNHFLAWTSGGLHEMLPVRFNTDCSPGTADTEGEFILKNTPGGGGPKRTAPTGEEL